VQQSIRFPALDRVGRRSQQSVLQTRLSIHPNVGYRAKVPRVTFFGLLHRCVTGAISVVCGQWYGNNSCVHHSTASHHQTFGGQVPVYRLKDARSQLVFFDHAVKLQQGRCFTGAFAPEIHTHKAANRLPVVKRIFNLLIGNPEALLSNVHAQHLLTPHWRAFAAFPSGIERFKLSHKERPRRYRLDLRKGAITSPQALLGVILKIREACWHTSSPIDRCNTY
jgi:hypothetical protein